MKVEIWSDVVCPFCYVGKRRFEAGLRQFGHPEAVEIVWRSFELTPDFRPVPGQDVYASLAEKKGIAPEESRRMSDHVAAMAQEAGLQYNFDRAVPANTFLAHQLIHLGALHGRQDAAKERLFAAYYTEGRDLNDPETLAELGAEVGLDAAEIRRALAAGTYAEAVRYDEYQAQQIGVGGVPFFVFEDKYAVSGAQPAELFAEVLGKVWAEAQAARPALVALAGPADGPACGPDGCD